MNKFIWLLLGFTVLYGQKFSLHDSIFVKSGKLDTALSYINSSRKDLFFPVKVKDYPFTFPVISGLFKDQSKQVKVAEDFSTICTNFPNLDFSLVYREFSCLIPAIKTVKSLEDFLQTVKQASAVKDSAWINCSQKEKEQILAYFKSGQSSNSLKNDSLKKYSFANDKLGNLFASRLEERTAWNLTHNFYKITLTKLKPQYFIKSGIMFFSALLDLQKYYLANPSAFTERITDTEFGRIAVGSNKDDYYRGSYFLILEPGGKDSYNIKCDSLQFQFIIDVSGDDRYLAEKDGPCAAFNGVSLLFDLDGSDLYQGRDNSNSAATLGFSILLDQGGNDTYLTDNYGQSAATLGFSCLWDKQGSDRYLAASSAQGYAGCFGISILADESGNDNYIAVSQQIDVLRYADRFNSMSQGFSIGERDHSGGGIAILCDKSGNDSYQSDIFGQGAGYWLAYGILLDYNGHDTYHSYQYTQGAGVHFAYGTLLDYSGNDNFRAKGVSMGCGHDYAGGIFIDASGDDSYYAESLSIGSGNADGVSAFFDLSGNDLYDTKEKSCLGFSDWRRDTGYIGIFWDNGGLDRYTSPKIGGNNKVWYNGTWGVGVDR